MLPSKALLDQEQLWVVRGVARPCSVNDCARSLHHTGPHYSLRSAQSDDEYYVELSVPYSEAPAKPGRESVAPDYYMASDTDVLAFVLTHRLSFVEGNVVKYVVRWRKKGGLDDLRKAKEYLERLIAHEQQTVGTEPGAADRCVD